MQRPSEAPERFYIVEVVNPGGNKTQYRVSVYNGDALLLSALYETKEECDSQCHWWDEFGYVRRSRARIEPDLFET